MNQLTTITNLDKAILFIEKASHAQLKELISYAETVRVYAIQSKKGLQLQNQAVEIKLRAERKLAEWYKKEPKNKGIHGGRRDTTATLKEMGLDKRKMHRISAIASLPEKEFEKHMAEVKQSNEELTTIGVIRLARELEHAQKEKYEPPAPPKGKFDVIILDPPWPYGTEYNSETRRVASPYPEMSIDELKEMSLPAADNCIVWLWTTHKFLPDSFELLKHWGFEYKLTLGWDKQKMGMGDWLRCQMEFCLLGIKGKPRWNMTNERDFISEARRQHSRKPEQFYAMVKKVCPGKRIDYFSREKREGYEQFGNQTTKF